MAEDAASLAARRRLYDAAVATPGSSARELQAATGLPWSDTAEQLLRLEEAEHLVRARAGDQEFYFPSAIGPGEPGIRALARSTEARRLGVALLASPGADPEALAERLGIGPGAVATWLRPLERLGIAARRAGPGAERGYGIADRHRLGQLIAQGRSAGRGRLGDRSVEVWGEIFPPG